MTDPFADLERELLGAHARDLKPRRHLRAAPRLVALTAVAAAVAFGIVWLGGQTDAERAASPQPAEQAAPVTPVTPVDGCAGQGWVPPHSNEPVPAAITERMAIFRRPAGAAENTPDPRMTGRQARRVYADGRRTIPRHGRFDPHLIAAEILPRAQVGRQDDPCAAPEGAVEPGVCLVLTHKEGAMSACFTIAEIAGGEAFLDANGEILGLAPDGPRIAIADGTDVEVQQNFFVLPGGPTTEVKFGT